MKDYTLLNGNKIPSIALGTWLIDDSIVTRCVIDAYNAGYRHIDTAQAYGNEVGVGKAIKELKINREDIYITSKVAAEIKDYKEAKESIDASIKRLNIDYIDLMLIHSPQPWAVFGSEYRYEKENIEVWRALEEAYVDGKVKAIGVSNFNVDDIKNIINNCKIKPMANQIYLNIGGTPFDILEYCQKEGIIVEAYSPIAHGRALNNKEIKEMADKYQVSIPQLCIKYTLQLGTLSIPKSDKKDHIVDNIKLNFTISDDDMEILKKIKA